MKKAVIQTGGKQYLVHHGQELNIEKISGKKLELKPLLFYDGKNTSIGTPELASPKVTATVVEDQVKGDKIKVLKYKPKKRYRKLTGHRQKYTRVKISIGK